MGCHVIDKMNQVHKSQTAAFIITESSHPCTEEKKDEKMIQDMLWKRDDMLLQLTRGKRNHLFSYDCSQSQRRVLTKFTRIERRVETYACHEKMEFEILWLRTKRMRKEEASPTNQESYKARDLTPTLYSAAHHSAIYLAKCKS
jgi:hypothetical protein